MPKNLSKSAKRKQPPPQLSPEEAAAKAAKLEQHIATQNALFPTPRNTWSTANMDSIHNDDELTRIRISYNPNSDWAALPHPYVNTLFPEPDHPTTWDEKLGNYARITDPRVWPLSCLDWIATFAENGASAAETKKYIRFHIDERRAGRGTPEQKKVGAQVPGMVSWDLVVAFHNFWNVRVMPGCVLMGSWEAAEAGWGELEWGPAVIDVTGEEGVDVVGMVEGFEELGVKNRRLLKKERRRVKMR